MRGSMRTALGFAAVLTLLVLVSGCGDSQDSAAADAVTIYGDGGISCPNHVAGADEDDDLIPVGTVSFEPGPGEVQVTILLTDAAPDSRYYAELWSDGSCNSDEPLRRTREFTTDGNGAGELDFAVDLEAGTYGVNVDVVHQTGDMEDPRHREMGAAEFTEVVIPAEPVETTLNPPDSMSTTEQPHLRPYMGRNAYTWTTSMGSGFEEWSDHVVMEEGFGDAVVDYSTALGGPTVVEIEHLGSGDFTVVATPSEDEEGTQSEVLVDASGPYQGRRLLDHLAANFRVTTEGPWSLKIYGIGAEAVYTMPVYGIGDDVFVAGFAPTEQRHFQPIVEHLGDGPFRLSVRYGDDLGEHQTTLSGNGDYKGELDLPVGWVIVEIQTDGIWRLADQPWSE